MPSLVLEEEPVTIDRSQYSTVDNIEDADPNEYNRGDVVVSGDDVFKAVGDDSKREWTRVTIGAGGTYRFREVDPEPGNDARVWGGYVDLGRCLKEATGKAAELGFDLQFDLGGK